MEYLDNLLTEEEINKIEKQDFLYTKDVISLDNKKNRKLLDYYAYQQYLKKQNKKNTEDNKGGGLCE